MPEWVLILDETRFRKTGIRSGRRWSAVLGHGGADRDFSDRGAFLAYALRPGSGIWSIGGVSADLLIPGSLSDGRSAGVVLQISGYGSNTLVWQMF